MFSFACISEHNNGIKGNLFTMKQILALFCPSAPLTTPLWLLCAAEGMALGRCWAQGQPKACWPSHLAHGGPPALAVLAHSALQPCRGNKCTWNQVTNLLESPRASTVLVIAVLQLLNPLNTSYWWASLVSTPIPGTAAWQANLQTTSKGLTKFVFPGWSKKQVL